MLTQSILAAVKLIGLKNPIVLKLLENNADIIKKIIEGKEKEIRIYYEEDFDSAIVYLYNFIIILNPY